jgi:signal transduction histidine kinase
MPSLPRPRVNAEHAPGSADGLHQIMIGNGGENKNGTAHENRNQGEDEQFLLHAFRSFAEAAGSLERAYGSLRAEVERLRLDLEDRNRDLARSLADNRNMRDHLDRILEGLPCGVLVITKDGSISRTNPEARRLLQIDSEPTAAAGASSGDPSALPSPRSLSPSIRSLLESARRSKGEFELRLEEPNKETRWLAARHALLGPDAEADSVFILRDVTEGKRLEQMQSRLQRDQALAEMSAILAHEIRNPLGSLELAAGLLAESLLDSENRQWVDQIQAGLRMMAATVNNVLHFHSLPEAQRIRMDLGQLLDWARDFFQPLFRQSHVTLSMQNRLSGIFFPADRHRLEQVLMNLVLNALRTMPGGGWIEIRGYRTQLNRAIEFAVADTGPGISPEDLPHIFEAGFSRNAGSSGLGLPVCRKIVEQHGGTIRATSLPGRGATFLVTFPCSAQASELLPHPDFAPPEFTQLAQASQLSEFSAEARQ